jgi:N-carbamoylputrescine amidase
MSTLNIALLQMTSHGINQQANLEKGDQFVRQAAALGTDIALFPEMWNIGYADYDETSTEAREAWQARAIGRDDAFVTHFQALAKELEIAIALTYMEQWPDAPRNTLSLINRYGEIVLTYAKVHTCDFSLEAALTPGDDFHVCTLDTAQGEVKIGAMICYDREFPESARILMLKGAEILLVPNACGLGINRLAQLRARAYENMVGIALTNYAAPQHNGHSIAFDGIAFAEEDGPSRDMLVVEAGENEGVYLARFDLDQLRDYRQRETWGNAYRKPRAYGLLTSDDVQEPFLRDDSRR